MLAFRKTTIIIDASNETEGNTMNTQELIEAVKTLQAEMTVVKTALKEQGLENLDSLVAKAAQAQS